MNVKQWILGVVAGVVLAGPVVAGDEFYLIKIVNYDRKRDVMTMSAEEFKTLEKNLKYEEKFFPKGQEGGAGCGAGEERQVQSEKNEE